jgi:hypothetical protein
MDILNEVKRWLPSDEEIAVFIIFGRKKNEILGETNKRSFYYKKKRKKENHLVGLGKFPMVGLIPRRPGAGWKSKHLVVYLGGEFKVKVNLKRDYSKIQDFFLKVY